MDFPQVGEQKIEALMAHHEHLTDYTYYCKCVLLFAVSAAGRDWMEGRCARNHGQPCIVRAAVCGKRVRT